MGNYVSSTLAKAFPRTAKVIFPSGQIRRLHQPTHAAELMLETPNHFLVDAKALQIGKRLAPLNADRALEIGGVYVFLPMKRLNSVVTAADVGAAFLAARKVSRVLPESGEDVRVEGTAVTVNLDGAGASEEMKQRLCLCRSKKPLLETIVEEGPVCMR